MRTGSAADHYSENAVTSVATEVQYLREAGLSTLDASRAATTTAPQLMRVQANGGRIARGYAADVLVVGASRSTIPPHSRRRSS